MLIIISQLFHGGFAKHFGKQKWPCCKKNADISNTENIPATSAVTFQMSIYLFFLAISGIGFLISAFVSQETFKSRFRSSNEAENNNIGQACVNAFKGVSDVIVTFMAYHRLYSIWNIQTHNSDIISFRRTKQKVWGNNSWILIQVFSAFVIGFSFHIPFFIDYYSDNGACDFYALASKNESYAGLKENRDWQTEQFCTIFLWIHITALKIIPTLLIVSLNTAIAWKLMEVWKKRKSIRKNAIKGLEIRIRTDASPRIRSKEQDNNLLCEPSNRLQVSVSSEADTNSLKTQKSNDLSNENSNQNIGNPEIHYISSVPLDRISRTKMTRIKIYMAKKKIARKREKYRNDAEEMVMQSILSNELPFTISSKLKTSVSKVEEMNDSYHKYLKQKEFKEPSLARRGGITHLTPVVKIKFGKMARIQNNLNKKKLVRQKENLKNDTEKIIRYSVLSIVTACMFLLCTLLSNIPLFSYPIYHKPFSWFTTNYLIIQHLLESFNYTSNFLIYCVANSDTRHAAYKLIRTCTFLCAFPLRWMSQCMRYTLKRLTHL